MATFISSISAKLGQGAAISQVVPESANNLRRMVQFAPALLAVGGRQAQPKLPVENRLGSTDFDPPSNKIKVMTMKVSTGMEFSVVALPGLGHMPAGGENEKEAARVFYVAATRATQRLLLGIQNSQGFCVKFCT